MKYESCCSNETFLGKRAEATENSHHRREGEHTIDAPANTSSTWSSLTSSCTHTTTTMVLAVLCDPNLTTVTALLRGSWTHGSHTMTLLGCMGPHKQLPSKEGLHSFLPWTKLIKPFCLRCLWEIHSSICSTHFPLNFVWLIAFSTTELSESSFELLWIQHLEHVTIPFFP
jgi:hypothetical protein